MRYRITVSAMPWLYMWYYIRIWSGRHSQVVTDLVCNTVPTPIRRRNVCMGERVRPREVRSSEVFGGSDIAVAETQIHSKPYVKESSKPRLLKPTTDTQDLLRWVSLVV